MDLEPLACEDGRNGVSPSFSFSFINILTFVSVRMTLNKKASEFNGQFSDVSTKSEHSQVPLLDRSAPFMEDVVVTKEGVTKLLKGLNPSKNLGPDKLHPRVRIAQMEERPLRPRHTKGVKNGTSGYLAWHSAL